MTNVPTVRLEATVGSMNIIKAIRRTRGAAPPTTPAKGGTPPFNTPRLHGYGGEDAQKQPLFYVKNLKRRSRDCESLRMILSVLGRVPAPVVGVNDAFLRL